jgi:hypothetical protein
LPMSAPGPSRHVALRSLTVAFGAKRKWRYHHCHAPLPATLDHRGAQQCVLYRLRQYRPGARLFLFRGGTGAALGGQAAEQRRSEPHGGDLRLSCRTCCAGGKATGMAKNNQGRTGTRAAEAAVRRMAADKKSALSGPGCRVDDRYYI